MRVVRGRIVASLTFLLALLAGYASWRGIFDPQLYRALVAAGSLSPFLLFGSVAQDLISFPAAILLAGLSLRFLRKPGPKILLLMLGLAAYFFYGYGLYVLQGQYTLLYPGYLAIFGLALYSLILGLLTFDQGAVGPLPRRLRGAIALFLLLILVVLVPVWLARMAPDIARHIPGETYGVFVLDLGVVFPALGITAVQLWQNRPFGTVLAGVALAKALTLCFSVAFAEALKPRFGYPLDPAMLGIFATLTTCSLLLLSFYLCFYAEKSDCPVLEARVG